MLSIRLVMVIVATCLFIQCSPEDSSKVNDYSDITAFSWDMAEGTTIKVLLNQHPYQKLIEENIAIFEEKTGIKVEVSVVPEENYFDKVTTSLNSRRGEPDVFMTGAYQIWDYAPAGYMEPLEVFIEDPRFTSSDYNFDDYYEGIVGSLKWNLKPGESVGTGSQWALPLGFESYVLTYNEQVFKDKGIAVPTTIEELLAVSADLKEFNGPGTYGVALRGSRNWATIHPAYMTTYANWGAKDIAIENGKLISKVNSPEAVAMTDMWVNLIREGGSPTWSSYTWYQAATDLGAGKAAMFFDADIVAYFQNAPGASQNSGNIVFAPSPLPSNSKELKSNLWVWALAMNASSKNKLAAWLFIQYFTSYEYQLAAKAVNAPRKAVFENPEYQAIVGDDIAKGYVDTFNATIDGTALLFTPHPYFTQLTTEWAATIQKLVAGEYPSTQAGMDDLKKKMDGVLSDIQIVQ